ncbi:MAG: hypothetical protein KDA80_19185 [Planctomycetaceae bacterium]|nr:hypothetical protein [Planctomycetaceae bacterium]
MDHTDLRRSLEQFGGYAFLNTGHDDKHQITWAKMRYLRDEEGHRSLEFLAWVTTDMSRGRDPISFYPTAAPPYLNEPGSVLSFVVQIYHDGMAEGQFEDMIAFIDKCHDDYYESCKP